MISNFRHNFYEYVWPGLGLFGESYLLFSIGTIRPIWNILYPKCFNGVTCSNALLSSLTYSVVIGIIIGMVTIGTIGGNIGRRNGSIATAALMTIGSIGLTFGAFQFRNSPKEMLKNLVAFLFIFGIGVGGEYPLSASSASERAMSETKRRLQNNRNKLNNYSGVQHEGDSEDVMPIEESLTFNEQNEGRGKRVILVFSMQGMGIFINALTITLLLFVTGQWAKKGDQYYNNYNNDDANGYYDKVAGNYDIHILLFIWQVVYAFGTLVLAYVFITRILYLQESDVWTKENQSRKEPQEIDNDKYHLHRDEQFFEEDEPEIKSKSSIIEAPKIKLLFQHYGHRLFGTSTSWLLWDIAFYGNKLFQSSFLYALTGEEATLSEISGVAVLNAFVSLLGYYAAAVLVDRPSIGRLKLQQYGFLLTGTLFCLCGYLRDKVPTVWLIIMYFGSSFFGQCGPNCTTFLIPAELFPTEMRTLCHGISAAAGKIGALVAAVMFNYVSESGMFLMSGYCSFLAWFITFLMVPETATLDLNQLDIKWRFTVEGKSHEYCGSANELRHLSTWERWQVHG